MDKRDQEALEIWKPWIEVYQTAKFYNLYPYSGYILQFADPEVEEIRLPPDTDDGTLGQTVLNTLKKSRFLPLKISNALEIKARENYPLWVKKMIQQYGYKNKTALFKNMKSCDVMMLKDCYKIKPLRHERLEGWGREGMSEDDNIHIPLTSTPEEIGAALRLGFTRCKER